MPGETKEQARARLATSSPSLAKALQVGDIGAVVSVDSAFEAFIHVASILAQAIFVDAQKNGYDITQEDGNSAKLQDALIEGIIAAKGLKPAELIHALAMAVMVHGTEIQDLQLIKNSEAQP